jgi:hypothetical protein
MTTLMSTFEPGNGFLNRMSALIGQGEPSTLNQSSPRTIAEVTLDTFRKALQTLHESQPQRSKSSETTYVIHSNDAEWHSKFHHHSVSKEHWKLFDIKAPWVPGYVSALQR